MLQPFMALYEKKNEKNDKDHGRIRMLGTKMGKHFVHVGLLQFLHRKESINRGASIQLQSTIIYILNNRKQDVYLAFFLIRIFVFLSFLFDRNVNR